MSKISFEVSARTARLIGQENFANAEGAIIELVKNSYDADAKNAIVVFDLPYPTIPKTLESNLFKRLLLENQSLLEYYHKQNDFFQLKEHIPKKKLKFLRNYFFNKNVLYIIDDGEGMNKEIIETKWMKIGTNNKLIDYASENNRIKTGAKGIGRFALDRLGQITNMRTIARQSNKGWDWQMNWQQFEDEDKTLSDIEADLNAVPNFNLKKHLLSQFQNVNIKNIFSNTNTNFKTNGTIIKIASLRDNWDTQEINKLFRTLESLVPPEGMGIFNIHLFHIQNLSEYGKVSQIYFNDFDYKVSAKVSVHDFKIKFFIKRKELDFLKIQKSHLDIFKDKKFPYNIETLKKETFNYEKSIDKILRWEREESEQLIKRVGDFSFTFYVTKLKSPNKRNKKIYPYRDADYQEIRRTFEKFGGIKIFRDNFRVRPYGDFFGDDWLDLGKRAASSPTGAGQRVGDWRVRSRQIAGLIHISRIANPHLKDKSDRSALIENDEFGVFKNIIIGIIHEFEFDRSKILNPFYLKNKAEEERKREEENKKRAAELAKKILDTKQNKESDRKENTSVENTTKIIHDELNKLTKNQDEERKEEAREKELELRFMKSLASLGLIVASFDHELKAISNNLEPRLRHLTRHLKTIISNDVIKQLPKHKNPFTLIKHIKGDHEKLKGWIDYSLNAIKTDKRKRKNLNFGNYFDKFSKNWKFVLIERNVTLSLKGNKSSNNVIRAFEIDMDTIFNNLLTNSLEAFKARREKYNREIEISWKRLDTQIEIFYQDNGVGLSEVFDNPEDIFLPFVTSKKDKRGNNKGTGLGMYLVKNVIEDYGSQIEILKPQQGFKVKILFNTRKKDIVDE